MLPFLATALDNILRSLLGRIVKKEVLNGVDTFSKLLKLDLEKPKNIISAPAFDIGFSAKMELRKISKPSQLSVLNFKKECISF